MRARGAALLILGLVLVACGGSTPASPTAPAAAPPPPPPPRVVILSIDGLRPDALSQTLVPNIMALAGRGAFTWAAQTVYPPTTLPSHTSMLSGHLPNVHGMTWADWTPSRGQCPVPTVFSIAHAQGHRTVMVVGKEKFKHLVIPGSVDTFMLVGGDEAIANEAVVQAATDFDLMFVHFPDVDFNGHASGWLSARYLAQLTRTDTAVGRVIASLPEGTTVILSADHGGVGMGHGRNIPTDMTIPWIMAGPKVASNKNLQGRVTTTDTAATALKVLGLSLAADAPGRAVTEAFSQAASAGQ